MTASAHGAQGSAAAPTAGSRWLSQARRDVWLKAANHGGFGIVPVFVTGFILAIALGRHSLAVDFHNAFWPAGSRVLDGLTPYTSAHSFAATHGFAFVYPAPGALIFAAIAWIPRGLGDVLVTLACAGCALGTLRVLAIRDWRLYGLILIWPPVISGWQTANLSLPLALGTALAWTWRSRPIRAGVLVGVLVSVKLFLWPLGLWLLLARRFRALAWAIGTTLVVNAVAWAILGVGQVHAYAQLASAATRIEEKAAYTPLALALHLGATRATAVAVAVVLVAGCAWACWAWARAGREPELLLGAVLLSLLATPVVWLHYFVLLLVPVAIMRPRLGPVWLAPLLLFACPVTTPAVWQLVLALSVVAAMIVALLRRQDDTEPDPSCGHSIQPALQPAGGPALELASPGGSELDSRKLARA